MDDTTGWRKSSYSVASNDACVEVRLTAAAGAGIRDSKDPNHHSFWVASDAWVTFVTQVKRDERIH